MSAGDWKTVREFVGGWHNAGGQCDDILAAFARLEAEATVMREALQWAVRRFDMHAAADHPALYQWERDTMRAALSQGCANTGEMQAAEEKAGKP